MRQARLAAGLSLGEVAGDDVSRTLIHFIEHGRSRPSRRVLELIAERTGRPVSYFTLGPSESHNGAEDSLARQLSSAAGRVKRFAAAGRLSRSEREAVKLVEVSLRLAATLIGSLEGKAES